MKIKIKNRYIHYLLWGLVVILFAPLFINLYRYRWDALNYTHAHFILPVSLGLAYRKREQLREAFIHSKKRFGVEALLTLIFGIFLYLFGWHQEYAVISTFAIIPFLYGLIGFIYGTKVRRLLLFPVLYLILLVPPPFSLLDSITLPLRYISVVGVEGIFRIFDFPFEREGLMYIVKGEQMMVDTACSGFRSLITMFALGLPYVYCTAGAVAKKRVLILSIVPLAVMGNILRIMVISLMTVYLGPEIARGFLHYFSGAIVFLFIVAGFLAVEMIWRKKVEKGIDGNESFEWFE